MHYDFTASTYRPFGQAAVSRVTAADVGGERAQIKTTTRDCSGLFAFQLTSKVLTLDSEWQRMACGLRPEWQAQSKIAEWQKYKLSLNAIK